MPLSNSKVKCPRCGKFLLKRILKLTNGKCNNCGYLIANSITSFIPTEGKTQAIKL